MVGTVSYTANKQTNTIKLWTFLRSFLKSDYENKNIQVSQVLLQVVCEV